jgi:hypothetical protein
VSAKVKVAQVTIAAKVGCHMQVGITGFSLLIAILDQEHLLQCKILNVKQLYDQVLTGQLSLFNGFIEPYYIANHTEWEQRENANYATYQKS